MSSQPVSPTPWYGALGLAERLASTGGRSAASSSPTLDPATNQRLERWRSQPPFDRDGLFARRLAMDGLDEAQLAGLLATPVEELGPVGDEGQPGWLVELDRAFATAPAPDPERRLPFPPLPGVAYEEPEFELLWLAGPLVARLERRLHGAVARLVREAAASGRPLPFDPERIVPQLLAQLPPRLLMTITRTAVLELNIARLEGTVEGATPEERFRSFVGRLRDPRAARALLEDYPVLARQLQVRTESWAEASIELLERLVADWDEIVATFAPATAEPGVIATVASGAGDRHRGGRTVAILTFSGGWKLVYKPRPMGIAVRFQEILAWLGKRGFEPGFRPLGILPRDGYGWIEFVEHAPCTSEAEVRRFYLRQGGALALLYALDAADFHRENLIAAGEHPVLIDLESVVQPRSRRAARSGSEQLATDELSHSVLRVGLLPQLVWGRAGNRGIDLSGLGSPAGQMSPEAVPTWTGSGTDEMRLERRHLPMIGSQNRPTLDGSEVELIRYLDELADGFTRVYRLLAAHREELLAPGGPFGRLAQEEVRVILRPTRVYGLLLQESFHPHLLRAGLDRDRHFDRLWLGVADNPDLEAVIPAELEELARGDVPLFITRVASRDLEGVDGRRFPDYFEASGMELVEERLGRLSERDLGKQIWFVRASIAAYWANVDGPEIPPTAQAEVTGPASREALLVGAVAVADRLEELALREDGEATWIGITSRQGRDWTLSPLGVDLYSGIPGVVLFLAYLARATGEERIERLAREGFEMVWRRRDVLPRVISGIGGFDGWGSLLYTWLHLGVLWDAPELLAEAEAIAGTIRERLPDDTSIDVMGGAAGAMGALVALARVTGSPTARAAAVACGERLLELARPMDRGAAWPPPAGIGRAPLAGFAHGTAGIAWALLELARLTGEARFRRAALAGLAYERTLFVSEQDNWRDVRDIEKLYNARQVGDDAFMLAWCHGAPGVGLSRLAALEQLAATGGLDDDEAAEILEEIQAAVRSTRAHGLGRNHCLCHGDLGNAELFLQAAKRLPEGEAWHAEALEAGARVLAGIERHGWLSGLPEAVEAPGLLSGIAGIGYGLLRLAEPDRVPAVLLLEPPPA